MTCKLDASRPACRVCTTLLFNRGTSSEMTVCGKNIISMALTETFNSTEGITMGAACSNKLSLALIPPEGLAFSTSVIEPVVTVGEKNFPLGRFYVCDAVTENGYKTVTLECYDGFLKTEKLYVPTVEFPSSIRDITADIAQQCGFEIEFDFEDLGVVNGNVMIERIGEYTCRQMLGYIGGIMGTNAHFNRNGKLAFEWYYDTDISVEKSEQYMGQFRRLTKSENGIESITTGTSDEAFTVGNGRGISFENPYMTEEMAENILEKVSGFAFQPCSVKYRGNPKILPAMIVNVKDDMDNSVRACVMEQTFLINGGLSAELYSYGKSEEAHNFDSSTATKALSTLTGRMEKAVMMEKDIENSKGGVFLVLDEDGDGINDGFILRSASGEGNYIKGNKDGIILKNADNAEEITVINQTGICTGAINIKELFAEQLSVRGVNFEDAFDVKELPGLGLVVTLGSGTGKVIMCQEDDRIAFHDKEAFEAEKYDPLSYLGLSEFVMKNFTLMKLGNLSIQSSRGGKIIFSTGGAK